MIKRLETRKDGSTFYSSNNKDILLHYYANPSFLSIILIMNNIVLKNILNLNHQNRKIYSRST